MKKKIVLLLIAFIANNFYSQNIDALIKFKDGKELRGIFKSSGNKLKAIEDKKTYHINDMKEIIYFNLKDTIKYHLVDTKNYTTSKNSKRRLLRKVYEGKKLTLYAITHSYQSGGTVGMTTYGTFEGAYIQRKNENFAFDMGFLYGVQYKGIKKRVKKFFSDCPELVRKVKKNEIDKNDTMKMVLYYEGKCSD
jgi:hypothetical protein